MGRWKLIYCETYVNKMDALGREKFLKSGSGWRFLKKQLQHYLDERDRHTQWKSLGKILVDQVPIQINLRLGNINKQYLVIQEEGYCCEMTNPVVLGHWARYVIDVDTLKIVDVYFDK